MKILTEEVINMGTNMESEIAKIMSENDNSGGHKKKRFKLGKFKIVLILAVIVLIAFFVASQLLGGRRSAAVPVESSVLERGHIEDSVSVTGPVEGTDSVTITSGIHAKITEINVKEGDEVVENETVLARIDTEELLNRVETAKGQYDLAVANKAEKIKNDQSGYNKAAQAVSAAQGEYNRKAELAAAGAIPQSELDAAANALNSARSELSQFKTKNGKIDPGESYDIQINNAKLEVERLEKQLESATLIAPISGTVTRVYAKVGRFADQAVDNNPTLITIEKLDKLQLNLAVSEYNIGKIKIGQKVEISADMLGSGNTVEGEVEKISPSGEIKQGSASAERVIPVKVNIKDSSSLISGISAKANIIIQEKDDVYAVPIGAVGDDGTGQSVMQFIKETGNGRGIINIVPVKTGIEGEVNLELLDESVENLDSSKPLRYMSKYDPMLAEGTEVDYMSANALPKGVSQEQTAGEAGSGESQ